MKRETVGEDEGIIVRVTDGREHILTSWCNKAYESSRKHQAKARAQGYYYKMLAIPSTIFPLVITGMQSHIKDDSALLSSLLIISSVVSGLNAFMDYGQKREKNIIFSARYGELAEEIQKELAKPRDDRVACDVFMERTMLRLTHLNESAPALV